MVGAAVAVVILGAAGATGSAAVAADADPSGTRVKGSLLLVRREHWEATGAGACVGAGLYGDVGRGMRVVVRDEQKVILAKTMLRSGKKTFGGCRHAFVTTLPDAEFYNFQIGPHGAVYQTSFDDSGLRRKRGQVDFVIA